MLSKYVAPDPLTVTIVAPFDSGEIIRQVKKEAAGDCTTWEIFTRNALFAGVAAQRLNLCFLLTSPSALKQFLLYHFDNIFVS